MKLAFFVVSAIAADSVDDLGNKKNSKCHRVYNQKVQIESFRKTKQGRKRFHMHGHMDVDMQLRR